MKRYGIHKIIQCTMFCALIIIGAYIKIPIPPVPLTMQTAAVILSGICLGAKGGMASVLLYMFLGLVGLPVFSGGGGIGYVLTPYFGYVIGFAIAVIAAGIVSEKKNFFMASFIATVVIYVCEIIWYFFICGIYTGNKYDTVDFWLSFLLIPFIKDILLFPFVASVAKRIKKCI